MSEQIPADHLRRMRGCVGFEFPVEEMLRLFGHIDYLSARVKVLEGLLREVQWNGSGHCCPFCGESWPEGMSHAERDAPTRLTKGHHPSCRLTKALQETT